MPTAVDLLHELTQTPDLPGAACVAERDTFDAALEKDHAVYARPVAVRICATCLELSACRDWISALPPEERPLGVTAGVIRRITVR